VVDNLKLTGSTSEGTIVYFEKTLEWLPGAAGQHLLSAKGSAKGSAKTRPGPAGD
jgi:hypothetical protein